MFDAIEFRGFKQSTVETLAEYSGIPVYNGLTDDFHPTQALADMMTIEEYFDKPNGKIVTYVGDGRNNVAISLMIVCAKMGVNFRIVSPKTLSPEGKVYEACRGFAASNGVSIEVFSDIKKGIPGSDVVYTDVWVSMGEEKQAAKRKKLLAPYQVDTKMMALTGMGSSIFMHCLPAVQGEEVTEEVFEGRQSKVFDQAENRKHTIKAVMLATLGVK
jgi:ornithine carbamoyltransferase